jgi:hypothetical protein
MESLNATYGAAFVGLLAGAILYGVTLLQTFLYFRNYPKDTLIVKLMVVVLWILDTAHLVLCTIAIYWYLVVNFSNTSALDKTTWSMSLQTDCNGLIGLIVECFFARRVWIMSRNWFLTGIIVLLACIHFGLGIVFTVEGLLLVEVHKFGRLIWVTSAGLGSAAAADVIIAGSLCYYLLKSRTGFTRTDSLITTLIVYSLTTGLITSVIAMICVITFAIMPTNFIWLAFFWVMGKCYVNSALAALNSRTSLREKVGPQDGTFLQLSHYRGSGLVGGLESPQRTGRSREISALAVNVHTQTVSKTDYCFSEEPPSASKSCSSIIV